VLAEGGQGRAAALRGGVGEDGAVNLTEEQQRIRRGGITGTDICALMAPVLGIPSFRTPFQVFAEKMGKADPVEVTEDMERGTFLEDGAATSTATLAAMTAVLRAAGVSDT
jgi:predicted phage-related endonuclease